MKETTLAGAIARYGHIDFASKYWPQQGQYLQMLDVSGMFPNWHVLDSTHSVGSIACNIDMKAPLLAALNSVKSKGLGGLLHSFDGCFNIRMVRGTNASPSAHSYGLAIDINASLNLLGSTHGGFYDHPEFVKCFTDEGFSWGGHWPHRKDPMHFSYCWE